MHVGQNVGRDRLVGPETLELGIPDPELRHDEEEERRHVIGENGLRLAIELVLFGRIGSRLYLRQNLVEAGFL